MKLSPIYELSADDRALYQTLWPEVVEAFDKKAWRPPLDDHEVMANIGDLPHKFTDKLAVLRMIDPETCGAFDPLEVQSDVTRFEHGVVVKPRYNAGGLGRYVYWLKPGKTPPYGEHVEMMWQAYWKGMHISVDMILINGEIEFAVWAQGLPHPVNTGRFLAWSVYRHGEAPFHEPWLWDLIQDRVCHRLGLRGYNGMLNVELILPVAGAPRADVVEVHFRPSIEFGPAYGPEFRRLALRAAMEGERPSELHLEFNPITGGSVLPVPWERPEIVVSRHQLDDSPGSWRHGLEYEFPA